MTKLGLFVLGLIFGGTIAMALFIAYNIIWETFPVK
jgi:hypothetical protein